MAYSEKEIKAFEAKDLRINRVALLKSLIESGRNTNENVEENKEIADKYVKYIYGLEVVCNDKKEAEIDWKSEAESMGVPIPTPENIKILRLVMDEYKKVKGGVKIAPNTLLNTIYKARNKYPTNVSSVSLVLKLIN